MTAGVHKCMLKMQATKVHEFLVSVSWIFDAGHNVVFHGQREYIQHEHAGQTTAFYRDNKVYSTEVQMLGMPTTGATPQGE